MSPPPRRSGLSPLLAVLALLLAAAPAAQASDFQSIFGAYKRSGAINGCDYSDGQLRRAQGQIPPDIEQYAPSFAEQLAAAREKRARGECDRAAAPVEQAEPAPVAPARRRARAIADPPAPEASRPPRVSGVAVPPLGRGLDARGAEEPPAAIWVLAALAGLGGLAGAVLLGSRLRDAGGAGRAVPLSVARSRGRARVAAWLSALRRRLPSRR